MVGFMDGRSFHILEEGKVQGLNYLYRGTLFFQFPGQIVLIDSLANNKYRYSRLYDPY